MQIGDKAEAVRQSVAAVVAGRLSSTLSGIASAKVMADKRRLADNDKAGRSITSWRFF
jgi:hypothetical protein